MYKVILKHQTPDYKWNKITIHPFIKKDEADKTHEKQSYIVRELMAENKIIDTIEPVNEYDIERYIIEIPDWIINNNQIPVFDLCELALDR